jgi:hypothetical protein
MLFYYSVCWDVGFPSLMQTSACCGRAALKIGSGPQKHRHRNKPVAILQYPANAACPATLARSAYVIIVIAEDGYAQPAKFAVAIFGLSLRCACTHIVYFTTDVRRTVSAQHADQRSSAITYVAASARSGCPRHIAT